MQNHDHRSDCLCISCAPISLPTRFPESLARVCDRLSGVMIENRPALTIIDQHDAEDTLFCVDPPYLMSTRCVSARHGRYYDCEMTDDDHHQLLAKLCAAKGMVVLSGYPSDAYKGGRLGHGQD